MCVSVCMCCVFTCVCKCRPEADVGCLPGYLSILFFYYLSILCALMFFLNICLCEGFGSPLFCFLKQGL